MKNTIEINGFTISIEDNDGVINIKAIFGDKEAGDLSLDPREFTDETGANDGANDGVNDGDEPLESNESLLDFEKFTNKK